MTVAELIELLEREFSPEWYVVRKDSSGHPIQRAPKVYRTNGNAVPLVVIE